MVGRSPDDRPYDHSRIGGLRSGRLAEGAHLRRAERLRLFRRDAARARRGAAMASFWPSRLCDRVGRGRRYPLRGPRRPRQGSRLRSQRAFRRTDGNAHGGAHIQRQSDDRRQPSVAEHSGRGCGRDRDHRGVRQSRADPGRSADHRRAARRHRRRRPRSGLRADRLWGARGGRRGAHDRSFEDRNRKVGHHDATGCSQLPRPGPVQRPGCSGEGRSTAVSPLTAGA